MSIIWIAFEVIINFYEGFMETYFIYKFLPPKTESTKKNIIAFALCFCTLGLLITVMNYLLLNGFVSICPSEQKRQYNKKTVCSHCSSCYDFFNIYNYA